MPGRSAKVKGREEEEEDEDSGVRRIRNEMAHEVVTSIKEKTSAHEEANTTTQRTKLKNEDEEEELWQKEKPNGSAVGGR